MNTDNYIIEHIISYRINLNICINDHKHSDLIPYGYC